MAEMKMKVNGIEKQQEVLISRLTEILFHKLFHRIIAKHAKWNASIQQQRRKWNYSGIFLSPRGFIYN
jgi:hypothetical protein